MRVHLIWVVALFSVLETIPVVAADWSMDVVPESSGTGGQTINLRVPFHVVLTNTTDHDLLVWKEWCSDGYFNLSFEFTDKDGKVIKVNKNPNRIWAKNFPAGFVVNPGKHFVLSVTLSSEDQTAYAWIGTENLQGVMTMKAIYKNACDDLPMPPTKLRAWTGQMESAPLTVTIWR